MESGIFVCDFGNRLEEVDLPNSDIAMGYTFLLIPFHMSCEPLFLFLLVINFGNICKLMYSSV